MVNQTLSLALTRALEYSEELCKLAREGQWEAFERMLAKRNAQLEELDHAVTLCQSLETEEEARVAEQLQALKDLNQTMLRLARARQEGVASEGRQSKKSRKALDAYRGERRG